MPRLASLTNQQFVVTGGPGTPPDPEYVSLTLDAVSYNEGDTITATLTVANIDDGVTVGYTVTGISTNDLDSGSLSGTFTVNNNSATATWALAEDGLTEGTDTFQITLAVADSAGNATGSLTRTATVLDTSNDPTATLWLDDNDDPVTVRSIIGGFSMQMNGVFAVNPTVPFSIEGRISGARTTVTNITANTGTFIEVDDSGNSTSFIVNEQLNLTQLAIGDAYGGGYYAGDITIDTLPYRLIVAPVSTETTLQFKTTETSSSGAADNDDGFANTEALNTVDHPAASYTRGLTTDGYTDWYLPTYLDKDRIVASNSSLPAEQQLSNQTYWLSYTASTTDARIYNPVANTQGNSTKTESFGVRAVRRELINEVTITPASNNVNEGSSLLFQVATTDIPDATTLYWTVSNAGEFDTSSGSFTISSDAGSFSVTPSTDITRESAETFTVSIRTGAIDGTIIATSDPVTINDLDPFGGGFNNVINTLTLQSDSKILAGGNFITYDGNSQTRITRLNSDGTLDTGFVTGTGFNAQVIVIAIQSDGKILVGGSFTAYDGVTIGAGIARLNTDGTLDTGFVTGTGFNNGVQAIAIQSDGKILVGGAFTAYNGTTRRGITRLNADGTEDSTFTTNIGNGIVGTVNDIAIQADGRILVGGGFTDFDGGTVGRIVRLETAGNIDATFYTNSGTGFNSTADDLAIQSDGKIVVGGYFTDFNGTTVNRIARLNTDGSIDTTFAGNTGTGFDNLVFSLTLQPDDKILVGGVFTTYDGVTQNLFTRLNADGTRDTGFVTGDGFNGEVRAIALQSDGKIVLGGLFTAYDGATLRFITRLDSTGQRST